MKTAVFYDLENLCLINKNGVFAKNLGALQKKIEASEIVGEIILQKAYISKSNASLANIKTALKDTKIELVEVEPLLDVGQKRKNLVDFKMAVDVTATITTKRSISTVAIASGDSDFGFLCEQVKRLRKNLLVISRYVSTGNALLNLCDDWIDVTEQALSHKFIIKAINHRITADYSKMDFFAALNSFLNAIEQDLFLNRCMISTGLPLGNFVGLLNDRKISYNYLALGFSTMAQFLNVYLLNSKFAVNSLGQIKLSPNKKPVSESSFINYFLRLPQGYSREKLLKIYDIVAQTDDIDELMKYIMFMRRNGMINENKLCNKRTFRATIRKHIRAVMEKAGIALSDETVREIDKLI
ncbi:MAG: NYN domain-containing protein [Oscillospiraceae bacterium]|nr:NYN domain-containing protein [Oscillospiraceae bacterium]